MQYYSKSRKSSMEIRYFRSLFGPVDAYLASFEWATVRGKHRPVFVSHRFSPFAEGREPRMIQVKRVNRAHKEPLHPRATHMCVRARHAIIKGDTSILRRERIGRIERESKTFQGLIRRRLRHFSPEKPAACID